jgi:cytosine/adenosine deaminase-related metal-dependent hydrolase
LLRKMRPFNWLKTSSDLGKDDAGARFASTQTALAELALSGCTTASDHLYLFPNGSRLDDEIAAASELGVRLHASRGSMSLGESQGGLPPDSVVDSEEVILRDSQRLIERYHDPNPGALVRIVLAPCSPFSVTGDLMRNRCAGVSTGFDCTHLAETEDEEQFCLQKFGYRPVPYMQELGWLGQDVWFAHAVWVSPAEVQAFASHGCGVAHCPSSNMRLASGIAPIKEYRAAGVNVGLGVDGSASNDGSHMLAEARQAMLLARVREGITGFSLSNDPSRTLMTARDSLWMGTRGGAAVLGRNDVGSLEVGKCADFFAVSMDRLEYAGAAHDPVAAIVFCQPRRVDYTAVGGKLVVKNGELVSLEEHKIIERHAMLSRSLLAG